MRCHKCRLLRRKIRDRKWSSRRSGKMKRSCCLTSRGRRSSVATNRTQEEFLSRWQQPSMFSCASSSSSVLLPVCCRDTRSFTRNFEPPHFLPHFPRAVRGLWRSVSGSEASFFCDNLLAVVRNSWIERCFSFPFSSALAWALEELCASSLFLSDRCQLRSLFSLWFSKNLSNFCLFWACCFQLVCFWTCIWSSGSRVAPEQVLVKKCVSGFASEALGSLCCSGSAEFLFLAPPSVHFRQEIDKTTAAWERERRRSSNFCILRSWTDRLCKYIRRGKRQKRERERGQKNNRWSVMALLLNHAGRRAGNMLSTLLLRDAGTSRYLSAASIVQKEDNGASLAKDFASAESSREASSPIAANRGHGHAFAASLVLGAAAFYSSLQQVVCFAFSISLSLRISRLT